jgi:hypothetical protein
MAIGSLLRTGFLVSFYEDDVSLCPEFDRRKNSKPTTL